MALLQERIRNNPIRDDVVTLAEARDIWSGIRASYGFARVPAPLLTPPDGNAKFAKTSAPTYGLSLAPHRDSGIANVCPWSTPECRAACVSYAGKGELDCVQRARAAKVKLWFDCPSAAFLLLTKELDRAVRKHGWNLRVRLNNFSDIPWEELLPYDFWHTYYRVGFYDYTKNKARLRDQKFNYRLTYSASEKTTDSEILEIIDGGLANVAVVFDVPPSQELPMYHLGFRVVDGDKSDDRWGDPTGSIIGLRAKGRMRRGGFAMARAA